MIKKSSFGRDIITTDDGGTIVRATISISGQRECSRSAVDSVFEHLKQRGMEHIYGPILEKLNVLAGRLACEVRAFSTPHLGGRVNEEIMKVIAEIKTELEMR